MTMPLIDPAPIDPGAPPAPPTSPASAALPPRPAFGERFFAWTAGLGVVRGDGWIGGVAAGVAARLRIDPLIVRGVLVVIGLFGFPVLFVYALAWAVLPDLDGRIPLQDAVRGRFTPALAGIAACALLGLLPAPFAWFAGAPTLWNIAGVSGALTALAVLVLLTGTLVVAGLLVLIVRAAIHSARAHTPEALVPDQRTASAASEASEPPAEASGSGPDARAAGPAEGDAVGFAASASASDALVAPTTGDATTDTEAGTDPAPPSAASATTEPGTPDEEYAAWREQHAAWKVQDDAWRRQQQDAARAARDQARRERQAQAAAFSAEAAERRRIRRMTSPRTPFAFVATVLGIAIVAGAVVALVSPGEFAGAQGCFVAACVAALGMVVAGVARRRSGFLAFVTAVLLVGGVAATASPAISALHLGGYGISNTGPERWPASAPFVQPWGDLSISLTGSAAPTQAMHVEKGSGVTTIWVDPDVAVHLDIRGAAWAVYTIGSDESRDLIEFPGVATTDMPTGEQRLVATIPARVEEGGRVTDQTLVIEQASGFIQIVQWEPAEDAQ